jgi:hypothetical protein
MIALGVIKRARELAVGVPVLLAGQALPAIRRFTRSRRLRSRLLTTPR